MERSKYITTHVNDLVQTGILRLVKYQNRVKNPILVKKINGTWRMCSDFTKLNKAFPKDNYPLPTID